MAYIRADRVLESTTTTGTGALTLAGAVTGFLRFSDVCAVNDTVAYFIEAVDSVGQPTGDYEYGIGTYSDTNELTRTTVQGSSNAGAAVNLSAGTKNVAITLLSSEVDAIEADLVKATLTAGTAQTLSGASIDFTSIPSWVKRITVLFSGASTNGGDAPLIQLGDSGGIEATGYLGNSGVVTSGSAGSVVAYTTGFGINGSNSAAKVFHGRMTLELLDASTNTWVADGKLHQSNSTTYITVGGSKSLSATLDRIRITTENGTDAYDAGKVNILYE